MSRIFWTFLTAFVLASCGRKPTSLPEVDVTQMGPASGYRLVNSFSDDPSVTFFDFKASGKRIAYVLDFSGSMAGAGEKLLHAELADSIARLKADMAVAVIVFNNTATLVEPPETDSPTGFGAGWVEGTSTSLSRLLDTVREIHPGGGTNWHPALHKALQLTPKPETIFFMTDGVLPGDVPGLAKEIADANVVGGHPAVIHVIGIGDAKFSGSLDDLISPKKGIATRNRDPGGVSRRLDVRRPEVLAASALMQNQAWAAAPLAEWWKRLSPDERDSTSVKHLVPLLKIQSRVKKIWQSGTGSKQATASALIGGSYRGGTGDYAVVLASLLEAAGFETALEVASGGAEEVIIPYVKLPSSEMPTLVSAGVKFGQGALWGVRDSTAPDDTCWVSVRWETPFPGEKPPSGGYTQAYPKTEVLSHQVQGFGTAAGQTLDRPLTQP